ncbi:Eukaryotic translation initiation factor 3 subunit B [Raphanus sativus]|nr:Eukaryotic translation initiation factor 3 subunit B [Raphanus sativus]
MAVLDIDSRAAQLGIDWSHHVNLDSIHLPPGENFGIESDDEGGVPGQSEMKHRLWAPASIRPPICDGNQPAKVSLVQIPSKVELRQKNLFSVSDCKMYWQSSGEYLAVKVDRYTKTKKSTYSGFELFRIKERDYPHRAKTRRQFLHDEDRAKRWEGYKARYLKLKAKQANALFWSPTGKYIILAGLKSFNDQLEFFNVDEMETMATTEHFMATDIEWDPTGRYVATAVTSVHEMENGFTVWSFNGKLLYRVLKDHFFQLAWRPRPPLFLPPKKEEEIAKNLKKKYSKKYEAEDQDVSLLLSEQEREKRRALKEEWERWLMQWKSLHEEEKLERQNLRGGEISDEEEDDEEAKEVKEVEFEDVIDVTEEIVQE